MKEEIIFTEGRILTMDDSEREATAVVVKNGKIHYVGDDAGALAQKSKHGHVVSLKGKTMMPSFIDSHTHPIEYGMKLLGVDCDARTNDSIEDILLKLKETVENTSQTEWIRGWGWDDSKLKERRKISRWDLDLVAPHHPVVLRRTCGHVVVANSKALEISHITKETPQPQGGHLEKDSSGELTGILEERAQDLLAVPEFTHEQLIKGFKLAQRDFAKWGVTTIHDMSAGKTSLNVYQDLFQLGQLTVRVRPWIFAITHLHFTGFLDEMINLGIQSGFGNEMIQIQGMKYMLDGSVGGRTAAVAEPYEADTTKGILYFKDLKDIAPYVQKAIANKLRVSIHAIGERAIEQALQTLEYCQEDYDLRGMRNRIEHFAMPTKDHLQRIKGLEAIASSSVSFLYHIGDSYIKNLGRDRLKRVFPHKTYKQRGIIAPGHSDLPVTHGDPWTGIYAAVNRKTMSGEITDDLESISVYDALKAYTVDAAYASFEENRIGVIKRGASADLIILSDHPLEVDREQIIDLEVEETFINGQSIYKKE